MGAKCNGAARSVVIVYCDIRGYTQITSNMDLHRIKAYTLDYYHKLETVVKNYPCNADEFKIIAGDSAVILFEDTDKSGDKCQRAVNAADHITRLSRSGEIASTRMGLFLGEIVRATFSSSFGEQVLDFGGDFSAASRLGEICDFFDVDFLMDRNVALGQPFQENIVSIGKVTPKGFHHPIHAYTVYRPGIYPCPKDMSSRELDMFIRLKNEAMDYFTGNQLKGIQPDFFTAGKKLCRAQELFLQAAGNPDIATQRIIEYIHENPEPLSDFYSKGMHIKEKQGHHLEQGLSVIGRKLLEQIEPQLYRSLVLDTKWDKLFRLEWFCRGENVIEPGCPADGIYYILKGSVQVLDQAGSVLADLGEGDVFGDMTIISSKALQNGPAAAKNNLVVLKTKSEGFNDLPPNIQSILKKLGKRKACVHQTT